MIDVLKYNKNKIADRQIDTLIGLSKGILADGIVNQDEAEFLQKWLVQNQTTDNPIILNLLDKVTSMLEDDVLDEDEAEELASILTKLNGDDSYLGEIAKTTGLPLDAPAPEVIFQDKLFLFTGTCVYGTRNDCKELVISLGGRNSKNVVKSLDYLVLGTYVSDSWIHETFGRKIEKAIVYRDSGLPLVILTEEHFLEQAER